jgi:cytochrome c556
MNALPFRSLPRLPAHPMRALARVCLFAAALVALSSAVPAQNAPSDAQRTADVISSRKTMMDFMCDRMAQIEVMIGQNKIDVPFARGSGEAISAMLQAFPHLFPPSSNRWRPDDPDPVGQTLASPGIWTSFADFYRHAADAAKIAHAMGRADTAEDVKSRARELRIVCDGCHALYLEEP